MAGNSVFMFSDEKREMVSEERVRDLLSSVDMSKKDTYTHIRLGNKSFSEKAAIVLGATLNDLPAITVADIADMIAGRPEEEALRVLESVCTPLAGRDLVEVDISDNALGEKGVNACAGVLREKQSLERLYVCNNGMSAAAASLIADILLFRKDDPTTKLTLFHFFNNMSGDGGGVALARVVRHSPSLVDFRFSSTRAGREGCVAIASALRTNVGLCKLDLSDNTFGVEGGEMLGAAVACMTQLRELNLRDAGLEDEGLAHVARALEKAGTTLDVLDVSGNELTADGGKALVPWLRRNRSQGGLRRLLAEDNELGNRGAKILMKGLGQALSLTHLELSTNEITGRGGLAVAAAAARLPALEHLGLNGNMMTDAALEAVRGALADKLDVLGPMSDNEGDSDEEEEESEEESEEEMEVEAGVPPAEEGLEAAMAGLSVPPPAAAAAAPAAPVVFAFADTKREMVSEERVRELLSSLDLSPEAKAAYTHIRLGNKSFSGEAAVALGATLADLSAVSVADIADMIAGRPEEEALRVLESVCAPLAGRDLVEVDISDNALGEKGVNACAGVLREKQSLERLYVCNNGMSAAAASLIADILLFRKDDPTTKLTLFHFFNNMSGDGGGVALARVVRHSPSLVDFRFSSTRAGREGCVAIASALRTNVGLRKLDLSDNTFGVEGGEMLGAAVACMPQLRELNLRDAGLEDEGLAAVARALHQAGTKLKVLDVSGNDLTVEGAKALVPWLRQSSEGLVRLLAEDNELGNAGAKALLKGLGGAPNLACLELSTNEITGRGGLAVAAAAARLPALEHLGLNGNMMTDAALEAVRGALADKLDVLGPMSDNEGDSDEEEEESEEEESEEEMEVEAGVAPAEEGLEAAMAGLSVAPPAAAAAAPAPAAPVVFAFADTKREMVSEERVRELLSSLDLSPEAKAAYTHIRLGNKSFSGEAAVALGATLADLSAVSVADIADMIAGRPEEEALRVLESVCAPLAGRDLVEVDISDNALGEKGVNACAGVLREKQSLERLYVCNNGMSAAAASLIADILLFRKDDPTTKLTLFHFFNNMSGDGGGVALARVLRHSPSLVDFRFSSTRAGREGCVAIASALQTNVGLRKLDLSDNTFGVEGGQMLGAAVACMPQLQELNLRDAGLEDEGLAAVARALHQAGTKLKVLDVSGNDLTVEGAKALVPWLRQSSEGLVRLLAEDNELGNAGAKALLKGLGGAPNLACLELSTNEITGRGGLAVAAAAARLPALEHLGLNGNMMTDAALEAVRGALADKLDVLGPMSDNEGDSDEEEEESEEESEEGVAVAPTASEGASGLADAMAGLSVQS